MRTTAIAIVCITLGLASLAGTVLHVAEMQRESTRLQAEAAKVQNDFITSQNDRNRDLLKMHEMHLERMGFLEDRCKMLETIVYRKARTP